MDLNRDVPLSAAFNCIPGAVGRTVPEGYDYIGAGDHLFISLERRTLAVPLVIRQKLDIGDAVGERISSCAGINADSAAGYDPRCIGGQIDGQIVNQQPA